MIDHDCIDRILSLLSLYWHAKSADHFDEVVLSLLTASHCTTEAEVEERLRAAIAALDSKPIERHPSGCVAHSNAVGAWLRDGTKVVLKRDPETTGRAWLEMEKQTTVHLDDLAPPPPHDPLGLEMCPGITPPQEDGAFDALADLERVVRDIEAGKLPEVSPELLALDEKVCAQPPSTEPVEQWAKRLAGELVEDGCRYDDQFKRRWVKVQKLNEWEHETYFYLDGDKKQRHLSGSWAPGVLKSVVVRWPDGLADKLSVSVTSERRRVCEQGPGSYSVRSPVMEVGVVLHGVTVYINLSEFEIDPASCEWENSDE